MAKQQQQYQPFDAATFAEAAESAEAAFANVAFGKLGIQMRYLKFSGKGNPPEELTLAQYRTTDERQRGCEVIFTVDGSEFNPQQPFVYSRRVSMQSRDWRKTVAPSIIEVFGDYSKMAPGTYVEVEDVPQINDPQYHVPKFVRVFASAAECAAAWKARFSGTQTSNGIPPEVLAQARQVWAAVMNEDMFCRIAAHDKMLKQYDADVLLEAVTG